MRQILRGLGEVLCRVVRRSCMWCLFLMATIYLIQAEVEARLVLSMPCLRCFPFFPVPLKSGHANIILVNRFTELHRRTRATVCNLVDLLPPTKHDIAFSGSRSSQHATVARRLVLTAVSILGVERLLSAVGKRRPDRASD